MKFTFGIITVNGNLQQVIESIEKQKIDNFEIIIVGGPNQYNKPYIKHIEFNENIKPSWISKKKNIITDNASYDNIVYMHDYIKLDDGWYDGFKDFGNDWDICMTKIFDNDGTRYRDWTLWQDDIKNIYEPNNRLLLPYNIHHLSKMMYISGAYWVAKKIIMEKFRINEGLTWGQGEDVEWSIRVREYHNFHINEKSSVSLVKYKGGVSNLTSDNDIIILNNLRDYNRNGETYKKLLYDHGLIRWIK